MLLFPTQKIGRNIPVTSCFDALRLAVILNGVTGMTTTSDVALVGCNSIASESLKRLLSEAHRRIIYAGPSIEELRGEDSDCAAFLLILMEDQQLKWDGAALAAAHHQHPTAKIVILATEFDYDAMLGAFRAGVQGYLTNDLPWERLAGYLDLISFGEKIFPSQLADRLIGENIDGVAGGQSATIDSVNLSAREMEILQRLISGLPNKIISRQLTISEATVKVHVKAVLRKLGVANRTQAAIWAAAQGLQPPLGPASAGAASERTAAARGYPAVIDDGAFQPAASAVLEKGNVNGHAARA
jgi:two-component system nitrate/nitrite response regulator NarL